MNKSIESMACKSFEETIEIANKIKERDKEIERLTKQNKALNEMYELTKKEYIRLNNIIKEVREYIKENEEEYGSLEDNEKIILDILRGDKE